MVTGVVHHLPRQEVQRAGVDTIDDTNAGLTAHLSEADIAGMADTFARLFPAAAARARWQHPD